MILLLWGLLNIALFIFFVLNCFRATKLIRAHVGLFASIIFVFGLLSFVGASGKSGKKESADAQAFNLVSTDSLDGHGTSFIKVDLEKSWLCTYMLDIRHGREKQSNLNVPVSANVLTDGFFAGTEWKTMSVTVNKTANDSVFEYEVYGIREWKLLGANVCAESKQFKGIFSVKSARN